jgi:DNA invertase Pin-like site-specific DNA recombinase
MNNNERRSERGVNIMLNRRKREADDRRRPRAVFYIRGMMDENMVKRNKVPSITHQRLVCQNAATELDAKVVAEFFDTPGRFGPFPGMGRLIEYLGLKSPIDYLIVYSLDQLASTVAEAFMINWLLDSAGTILVDAEGEPASN